jgi:hypothetical protein
MSRKQKPTGSKGQRGRKKQLNKLKGKRGPMDNEEMMAFAVVAILILCFIYWLYKRFTNKSRANLSPDGSPKSTRSSFKFKNNYSTGEKYVQDDPYNAKVDLGERYGGLEKRQVNIDEIPTEQLILLDRDGKLNKATADKLRASGRLPPLKKSSNDSKELETINTKVKNRKKITIKKKE